MGRSHNPSGFFLSPSIASVILGERADAAVRCFRPFCFSPIVSPSILNRPVVYCRDRDAPTSREEGIPSGEGPRPGAALFSCPLGKGMAMFWDVYFAWSVAFAGVVAAITGSVYWQVLGLLRTDHPVVDVVTTVLVVATTMATVFLIVGMPWVLFG